MKETVVRGGKDEDNKYNIFLRQKKVEKKKFFLVDKKMWEENEGKN